MKCWFHYCIICLFAFNCVWFMYGEIVRAPRPLQRTITRFYCRPASKLPVAVQETQKTAVARLPQSSQPRWWSGPRSALLLLIEHIVKTNTSRKSSATYCTGFTLQKDCTSTIQCGPSLSKQVWLLYTRPLMGEKLLCLWRNYNGSVSKHYQQSSQVAE